MYRCYWHWADERGPPVRLTRRQKANKGFTSPFFEGDDVGKLSSKTNVRIGGNDAWEVQRNILLGYLMTTALGPHWIESGVAGGGIF